MCDLVAYTSHKTSVGKHPHNSPMVVVVVEVTLYIHYMTLIFSIFILLLTLFNMLVGVGECCIFYGLKGWRSAIPTLLPDSNNLESVLKQSKTHPCSVMIYQICIMMQNKCNGC